MSLWDNCPLLDSRRERCVLLNRTDGSGTDYGGAGDTWEEDDETFWAVITPGATANARTAGVMSGRTVCAILTARDVRLGLNDLVRRADGSVLRVTDPGHEAPESARLGLRLVMAENWEAAV